MGHRITESGDKICGATKPAPNTRSSAVKGEGMVCAEPEQHDPPHKDMWTNRTWK